MTKQKKKKKDHCAKCGRGDVVYVPSAKQGYVPMCPKCAAEYTYAKQDGRGRRKI